MNEEIIFIVPLKSAVVRFNIPKESQEVVISFESAHGGINRKDVLRTGFGEKFLIDNQYAVISILPHKPNWYRSKDIINYFSSTSFKSFLGKFSKIHTYGSSMGAYGAITYADILGANNVIALSPISTLAPDLAPWETRFRPGSRYDWTGLYADACNGIRHTPSVWLIYDPDCLDSLHVDRIEKYSTNNNIKKVTLSGSKHAIAVTLSAAGLLKEIIYSCLKERSIENVQNIIDINNNVILSAYKNIIHLRKIDKNSSNLLKH